MNSISQKTLESFHDVFILASPLHFVLNENMQFIQFGPAFGKICSAKLGDFVTKFLIIKNMPVTFSFELIKNSGNSIFLMQIVNKHTLLKGSAYFDRKSNCIFFLCTMVVKTHDELMAAGLSLTDFLPHDSIYDLIFSQQSFSSAIKEARQLVSNMKEHIKIKKLFNNQKIISKKLADLYESSPDLLLSTNVTNDEIIQCNHTVLKVLGYSKEELINRSIFDLITPDFIEKTVKQFKKFKQFKQFNSIDLQVKKKNGDLIYTSCLLSAQNNIYGKIQFINVSLRDITTEKELLLKTTRLANYDILTNLPNRLYFQEFFQKTLFLETQKKSISIFSLLLIDINNFKSINDYYGHHVGDRVLIEAGNFLKKQVGKEDFLARFGGDEFIIIAKGKKNTIALVDRIIDNVKYHPFLIHEHKINLQFFIGISFYPASGRTENELLKGVDIALHEAKKAGNNQYFYFNELLNNEHMARLEIENNLLLAIENQEFYLVYHPQINIHSLKITGLEVLLRWENRKIGLVPPNIFIPIAERRGLMRNIDAWVFDNACKQLSYWNNIGITDLRISINLSASELDNSSFPNKLVHICKENGVSANQIELEITETAIMNLNKESLNVLCKLDTAGFDLAIDDFGVEHSSLRRLCELPIKTLKIDKYFVENIAVKNGTVLLSIIDLAVRLGLNVIAEGVETQQELDFLLKTQCQIVQGYYFYKPLAADAMTTLLNSPTFHMVLSQKLS